MPKYLLKTILQRKQSLQFKEWGPNTCRTFNTSLILELAGFDSVQALLNPSQVLWRSSLLLGGSIVFANEIKGSYSTVKTRI